MRNLTRILFEHLDITSPMELYQIVAYTYRTLRRRALKKYKVVLLECKQLAKDCAGDKWTLGYFKALYTENFWTWYNIDGIAYDGDS